jgi:hypothetical protein
MVREVLARGDQRRTSSSAHPRKPSAWDSLVITPLNGHD